MKAETVVGVQNQGDGALAAARSLRDGSLAVSEVQGRYYELAYRGSVFTAYATVTAPVIYSTAAGTGGPLLWNNTRTNNAVLLAVGFATSVVTTVATGLGITGGTGQTSAPGSTTAIDAGPASTKIGAATSGMNLYRIGTPTNAGTFFLPLAQVHTGALTTDTTGITWMDLAGSIIVPPQCWASIAAGATATTLQVQAALMWAEVPA